MKPQRQPSRLGSMAAQLEALHRQTESPKTPRSSNTTVEHVLRGEHLKGTSHSPHTLSAFARERDMEDDHFRVKKSVLAKVKEKARKWRNTLSKKKNNEDSNTTPSWGVSLEDDKEEDPENLGAPIYESEMAPQGNKETARQHPRVIPEKNVSPNKSNPEAEKRRESKRKSETNRIRFETDKKLDNDEQLVHKSILKNHESEKPEPIKTSTEESETEKPTKTLAEAVTEKLAEAVTEKLAPAYTTVSDATQAIASKIQSLTVSTTQAPPPISVHKAERSPGAVGHKMSSSLETKQDAPGSAPAALDRIARDKGEHPSTSEQIWDKGVSVKEYLMHKLEPGEDERALSQVISDAISPRRKPGEVGVVEKFKEAVTSLLRKEEEPPHNPQRYVYHTAQNSLSFPVSSSSQEVFEEENHGRILQAN